jgi:hypothetical protein
MTQNATGKTGTGALVAGHAGEAPANGDPVEGEPANGDPVGEEAAIVTSRDAVRLDGLFHGHSVHVLTVTATGIARIVAFSDPALVPAFGLPATLPAGTPPSPPPGGTPGARQGRR